MSRIAKSGAWVLVVVSLAACATPPVANHSPVLEDMYVPIGGIDQWITIKGTDRSNPVVLFLHGGPGSAQSPVADSWFPGWERDFTLVQWDQRDAGRTFIKNGETVEPTITLDRMTEDGVEVAEFLRRHLHKNKIILTGGSWGSVLGIRMAHRRPDLFHAYVGTAQVTNWQQDLAVSYAKTREIAQAKSDQPALDALEAIGPPPWHSVETYLSFAKVLQPYQAELATAPSPPVAVASEYASDAEKYGARNRDFTFRYIWRLLTSVDITSLTDFEIPIFVIQGKADLTAPPDVARAYFETIEAPRKALYLVAGTGHNPSAAELEKLREVLLGQVRPFATQ